ncbi:MAG: MFS transporter [Candidatus Saccharimonadales bacterium]
MNASYKRSLEKNIGKYSWYKIFTKRVYLPLIAIQLVNVGKVTVAQLAIIATVTSIVNLLLQIPTGYIADKWGNRKAILIGASISAVSPLFYIFMPNFWGGLAASVLFFGGYVFQSGAIEAFLHDTLVALKKEDQYAKVMGRAQSYGLIGSIVLIITVPATYTIDKNLPFILGFISLVIMFLIAKSFTFPKVHHAKKKKISPLSALKNVVTLQNVAFFLFAGFLAGVSNRAGEYRELLMQNIGIAVGVFGLVIAASSIVGAILGLFTGILNKLKPLVFYMFDLILISSCLLLLGISKNYILVILGGVLFLGYSRIRLIVFQAKLLEDIKHVYKATLLSALSFFTVIGEVLAITVLAKAIGLYDYSKGYVVFSFFVFGLGFVLWSLIALESSKRR